MAFDLTVTRTNRAGVVTSNPYMILCAPVTEGAGKIFVRGGKFFTEVGDEIDPDDLPEWALDAFNLVSDAQLAAHGFPKRDVPLAKPAPYKKPIVKKV
jgi:hypothetical protein